MDNFVITIGREYGSCGYQIGQLVAKKLGIPIYYKDFIPMASKRMKMNESVLLDVDESVSTNYEGLFSRENARAKSLQDQLFACEKEIILELVQKESCIIVGHCASHILRDFPRVLNVFIYAPYSVRFHHIAEEYPSLSTDEVEMLIDTVDKNRHNYYKHYTKENRGSRVNRQIQLDSSILGIENSAQLLAQAAIMRFGLDGVDK